MVTISLKALKSCLNLFDLSIDCKIVTKNQMDSICGDSAAFCQKHSLASLEELDVG